MNDSAPSVTSRATHQTRAGIVALAARLLAVAGFAASSAILARRLDPAAFGTVAVIMSIATASSFLAAAGLNRVLLRDTAQALARGDTPGARGVMGAATRVLLVSMPLGAALATALSLTIVSDIDLGTALLCGATAIALAAILVLSDLLRGLGELIVSNLSAGRSGGGLALVLFTALLLAIGATRSVNGALVAYALSLCAIAALAGWRVADRIRAAPHYEPPGDPSADPSDKPPPNLTGPSLLKTAWPFAAVQLALFLTSQVDLWVVSATLTDTEAGLYGAALRFMTLVSIPLQAAQLALIARIAALHATGDRPRLQREVRRAATLAAIPAAAVLVPCIAVPGMLLRVGFGAAYVAAAVPLQLLALSQAINVASGLCGVVLAMSGRERTLLAAAAGGALGTAVASWIGARLGGLDGLALGSAASTGAMYTALWLLARRRVGIWTHPSPAALLRFRSS